MTDVLVQAPSAVGRFGVVTPTHDAPSPQELIPLLSARVRELEHELHDLETTAGVIANAALSLARVVQELEGRSAQDGVVVSGQVTREMEGARLILGQHGGDLVIRIGER
jgi:hypothetical protein